MDTGRADQWQNKRRLVKSGCHPESSLRERFEIFKGAGTSLPLLNITPAQCQLPAGVVPHATCMSADALPAQEFSRRWKHPNWSSAQRECQAIRLHRPSNVSLSFLLNF